MKITVNGEPLELRDGATVAALLDERGPAGGVAVAVNDDFVPRAEYARRKLDEGDRVEIVAPMQGG